MTGPEKTPPDNPSLVAQMRPVLVKYFRRKSGSAVEAEDLAQDVMVRVLTHADWKSQEQAKGYIFRAAVNRWRDRHRRLRTQSMMVAWDNTAEEQPSAQYPPDRVLIAQEELNQIARGLEELSVRTRMVLMLVKLEQMKVATVAHTLGISISSVNKHLSRGIAHLARYRTQQDEP